VELKDRLDSVVLVAEPRTLAGNREAVVEAESALVSLGYKPLEAHKAVDAIATEEFSVEQLVQAALKRAAKLAEGTA